MLAAGESLVARVQSLDSRIVEMNSGVNVQIESTVSRVNSYAREIAALNGRIAEMQGNVQQPPNDLLDQRERMISELNALVGSTTLAQSNGTLSVSFGTGQPLVIGEQAFRVEAAASPDTPQRLDVNYVTGSGSTLLAPQAIGGSLGALLASSCWGGMRVHAGRRADTVSVDGADIRSDSNLGLGAALVGGTPRDRQDYRHSAERKKAEKAGF